MEIADGQQRAPLLLEPLAAALVLAGGAVTVAAAVGPPMGAVTLLALPHRPTQLSGATLGQTAQHLEVMNGQGLAVEVFGHKGVPVNEIVMFGRAEDRSCLSPVMAGELNRVRI